MSNQRVSVAAVIIDDSESKLDYKIGLIQRIGEGNLWGFPAGMVEEGESTEEAVLRELMEETGYEGKVLGLRGIVYWGTNSVGYIYNVKLGKKVAEGEYPFEFITHTHFIAAISGALGKQLFKPQVHIAALYSEGGKATHLS